MPKSLIYRLRADCVHEFRAAVRQRYLDAVVLAEHGRRTAAIYLWGYCAEMTLKAAYYQLIGFSPRQTIGMVDLWSAKDFAKKNSIPFGNFHDLAGWAGVLIHYRVLHGPAYASQGFSNDLVQRVALVSRYWKEVIRYHKNVAYSFENAQVFDATRWMLAHSLDL